MCILSQAGNNINHLDMQWWGVQSNQASGGKKELRNQLYLLRRGQSPSQLRRKHSWRSSINLKGRKNTVGFRVRLGAHMLSHVWLFATPWTAALQAPLSMVILQARILEQAAISSCRESSLLRDQTSVSCIAGGFFTIVPSGKPLCHEVSMYSVAQSCSALCDPVEFSRQEYWSR